MRLCEQLSSFSLLRVRFVRAHHRLGLCALSSYKVITPAQALELFGARVARLEGDTVSPARKTKTQTRLFLDLSSSRFPLFDAFSSVADPDLFRRAALLRRWTTSQFPW